MLLLGVKNNVNILLRVETKQSNLWLLEQEVRSETEIIENTIFDNGFTLENAKKETM